MGFRDLIRPQWNPDRSKSNVFPMGLLNGAVVGGWQQGRFAQIHPPTLDYDFTQRQFRRYVGTGAQDVQLPSGFTSNRWRGIRYPYRGAGWLDVAMPRIPGQTRGNVAGFYPRQPSMSQLQTIISATAGSQPSNPSGFYGPGNIAGPEFNNPMTG